MVLRQGLDLAEESLRRPAGVGVSDQQQLGPGIVQTLERAEQGPRVVPVVKPAEEQPQTSGSPRREIGPVRRQRLRNPERHRVDELPEIGVGREALWVDAPEAGEKSEVELALLVRA